MIRRLITATVVVLLLAGGTIVWVALRAGQQGDTEIERWIGGQIIGMVDARLNRSLAFTELDYQYPATVRAKNLRLTADDPRATGTKLDFISADEAVITLGEIPSVGTPLVFERITFHHPAVRLVRNTTGKGLVGFTN